MGSLRMLEEAEVILRDRVARDGNDWMAIALLHSIDAHRRCIKNWPGTGVAIEFDISRVRDAINEAESRG